MCARIELSHMLALSARLINVVVQLVCFGGVCFIYLIVFVLKISRRKLYSLFLRRAKQHGCSDDGWKQPLVSRHNYDLFISRILIRYLVAKLFCSATITQNAKHT